MAFESVETSAMNVRLTLATYTWLKYYVQQ